MSTAHNEKNETEDSALKSPVADGENTVGDFSFSQGSTAPKKAQGEENEKALVNGSSDEKNINIASAAPKSDLSKPHRDSTRKNSMLTKAQSAPTSAKIDDKSVNKNKTALEIGDGDSVAVYSHKNLDKGTDKSEKSDKADKKADKDGKDEKKGDKKSDKAYQARKKRTLWIVKITIVSLVLSAFISFVGDLTASSEHIIVTLLLLLFLVLASILFDGIGVAVTSCDDTAFTSMASRKIYGAKTALWLVKNSEKVSSICNDVIGDIFGIISGACSAAIVVKIVLITGDTWQSWLSIGLSAVVSALTIGGKAFLKNIAISNSRDFVLFVSRVIGIFDSEERRRKKKQAAQKKQLLPETKTDAAGEAKTSAKSSSAKASSSNKNKQQ